MVSKVDMVNTEKLNLNSKDSIDSCVDVLESELRNEVKIHLQEGGGKKRSSPIKNLLNKTTKKEKLHQKCIGLVIPKEFECLKFGNFMMHYKGPIGKIIGNNYFSLFCEEEIHEGFQCSKCLETKKKLIDRYKNFYLQNMLILHSC